MSNGKSTIMIVDDHPLFRKGLQRFIAYEEDLEVTKECHSGAEALESALQDDPDLILLDLNMQGMDGLETLRQMRAKGVTARIVMLTVSDTEEDVLTAMQYGADGYLLKDMEPEDIVANIKQAVLGKLALSDRLTQVLAQSWHKPKTTESDKLSTLTDREHQTLLLLSQGMSNKLIAEKMKISEATAKVHVKNLLKKLELHSRLEAAAWLMKQQSKS
ncbi:MULTISPECIES: two-component system response regulator NarL [Vibrio]|uniref:Two-component system response regulator NarL n=2 Tax=Vibrio TaxID=662 RepID=A0A7X4LLE7_9VIBR|nr:MULTISPECIES: two-component system response regulator NarL [Vibrio]MBF9002189.1 two-component system response regulator NarL [Vibrio nitrifigilis]MZI94112.1 two-component system response regulator NarL [Vibrio eleionomae]